jgi:hypothetical protein
MADDVDVRIARDEAILAERAVALLEQERAERVADVAALDGTLAAAWTRLLGTREARIDAAVAAVRAVDQKLARARAHLATVRAAAEGVVAAKVAEEEDERERLAAREAALEALANGEGGAADRARTLLLEREGLRERLPLLDDAAFAGSELLGALNTVVRGNRRVAQLQTTARQALYANAVGAAAMGAEVGREFGALTELGFVKQGVAATPERAARFRAAVAALGREYRVERTSTTTVSGLTSLVLDGPLMESFVWESAELQANEYEELAAKVRDLMVPIDQERRDLVARLAALERELDALA